MWNRKKEEWDIDDWEIEGYEEDENPRKLIRKKKPKNQRPPSPSKRPNPSNAKYRKNNSYTMNGHQYGDYDDYSNSGYQSYGNQNQYNNEDYNNSYNERMQLEQEMSQLYDRNGYDDNNEYDGYDEYDTYDESRSRFHTFRKHRKHEQYQDEIYGIKNQGDVLEYDYDYEDGHMSTWMKVAIGVGILAILLSGFIFWGYWHTDFDTKGTAYVVPLEMHYERHYVKKSDDLLQLLIDINRSLDTDSQNLPSNYAEMSTKLKEESDLLKAKTNTFSKYVNVPAECDSYHSLLINFSLKTQEFIKNLLNNHASVDYEAFRVSGMKDFRNYFASVKQARQDLNLLVFRNIHSTEGLDGFDENYDKTHGEAADEAIEDTEETDISVDDLDIIIEEDKTQNQKEENKKNNENSSGSNSDSDLESLN